MLIQRIVTAGILIPVAVAAILYLPPNLASLLFAAFLSVGVLEWAAITGLAKQAGRIAMLLFAAFAVVIQSEFLPQELLMSIVLTAVVAWLLISSLVIRGYSRSSAVLDGKIASIAKSLACCFIVLLGAYSSVLKLLLVDAALLLLVFAIVWAADIGAYFVGRKFGKHKLASKISPGKTWEGVIGGLCSSALILAVGTHWMVLSVRQQLALLVLTLVAVSFSVFGDLFESLLKRSAGMKDSGSILPGHGGVLDRVDGLIAALPIFTLGYFLWVAKL